MTTACTCPACTPPGYAIHATGCPAANDMFGACSCGAEAEFRAAVLTAHPWTETQDTELRNADTLGSR